MGKVSRLRVVDLKEPCLLLNLMHIKRIWASSLMTWLGENLGDLGRDDRILPIGNIWIIGSEGWDGGGGCGRLIIWNSPWGHRCWLMKRWRVIPTVIVVVAISLGRFLIISRPDWTHLRYTWCIVTLIGSSESHHALWAQGKPAEEHSNG